MVANVDCYTLYKYLNKYTIYSSIIMIQIYVPISSGFELPPPQKFMLFPFILLELQ